MPPLDSQVNTRLILHSVLDTKMGQVPAESYNKHTEHTQAKSHDFKWLLSDKCEIPSSDTIISWSEQTELFGVAYRPGMTSLLD